MEKRNYILVGIAAILLCLVGGVVGATFSRYTSQATATPTAKVAKWQVKVNDQNISQNGPHSFTPKITWTNPLADKDVMAPGSTGEITFTINAEGTQVPVIYNIAINTEKIKDHKQIKIEKVTAEANSEGEKDLTLTNSDSDNIKNYNGTIDLNKTAYPITIKIKLKWENQDANNEDDTTIGATIENFDLPITVTASQKVE